MTIRRQIFEINTDTGTQGDTGPSFHGEVLQMRWNPDTGDTGADLQIALIPKKGDTGDGFLIYDDNDVLGSDFVRHPRAAVTFSTGVGNSGDTGYVPFVAAGDRLRVKVIPGGASVAGRLYIWTNWH